MSLSKECQIQVGLTEISTRLVGFLQLNLNLF